MDVSNPISSVVPGGRGAVLSVLARSGQPLSGRRVAELAGDAVGVARVAEILGELTRTGIATAESHPPAMLYQLNDDHVAARAIRELCGLHGLLLDRIRSELATWGVEPEGAWMFGSAARGDGDLDSDIDVLIVSPSGDFDVPTWESQLFDLSYLIRQWSGNSASILDYSDGELTSLDEIGEPLLASVRNDGIHLAGRRRLIPHQKKVA